MTATTLRSQRIAVRLFLSLELGEATWKLAFTTGLGQRPRERTIQSRDRRALLDEVVAAKRRLDSRTIPAW